MGMVAPARAGPGAGVDAAGQLPAGARGPCGPARCAVERGGGDGRTRAGGAGSAHRHSPTSGCVSVVPVRGRGCSRRMAAHRRCGPGPWAATAAPATGRASRAGIAYWRATPCARRSMSIPWMPGRHCVRRDGPLPPRIWSATAKAAARTRPWRNRRSPCRARHGRGGSPGWRSPQRCGGSNAAVMDAGMTTTAAHQPGARRRLPASHPRYAPMHYTGSCHCGRIAFARRRRRPRRGL